MNQRKSLVVILGVAAICLWLGTRQGNLLGRKAADGNAKEGTSRMETADHADGAAPVRTKVAVRSNSALRPTHSPERLREFMLPAVAIEGLNLDEALRQLVTAYEEACKKTGETPLPLTFSISPTSASRKLTLHLPAGNFNTAVQLLATLSGMKASRKEREYRFEPLSDERKPVSRELLVPPDFNTALGRMAGMTTQVPNEPFAPEDTVAPKPVRDWLTTVGLDLDPSTHVTLAASGKLTLETTSTADAAAISDLANSLSEQKPLQTKFIPQLLEIPAVADWTPPDGSQMTDGEVQTLMREMSQKQGVKMQTLPSITARNSQNASIEMVRECIYPTDDSGKNFETRDVGKVLNIRGNLLGFGNDVGFTYSDTTVEMNPSAGKIPVFSTQIAKDTGFSSDGGSRFIVQTRPDGSKTVLLVSSTLIDATGTPIH